MIGIRKPGSKYEKREKKSQAEIISEINETLTKFLSISSPNSERLQIILIKVKDLLKLVKIEELLESEDEQDFFLSLRAQFNTLFVSTVSFAIYQKPQIPREHQLSTENSLLLENEDLRTVIKKILSILNPNNEIDQLRASISQKTEV
jgi:Flp pilus assembly CpaF family ATPase